MTDRPKDTTQEPEGGEAAERLRGRTEQQLPGEAPAQEPEDSCEGKAGEEEAVQGTEQGTSRMPRGDYPAKRLLDFLQRRFPESLPESSLPWAVEPEELESAEDREEDTGEAAAQAEEGNSEGQS